MNNQTEYSTNRNTSKACECGCTNHYVSDKGYIYCSNCLKDLIHISKIIEGKRV